MDRQFAFGKYKGQDIKEIILTHIGYVMWCFENINGFYLNDEEQMVYDACAICIKKYNVEMAFPVELMYKYVKNREALDNLDTPFIDRGGYQQIVDTESPVYASVKKYLKKRCIPTFDEKCLLKYFAKYVIDDEMMANCSDDFDEY